MATPTLWELMVAVEQRAKSVVGLRAHAGSPGQISPPTLIVGIPTIDSYRATYQRGTVEIKDWGLFILTSAAIDRVGQKKLAEYMSWTGEKSLIRALEDEPTLGGLVSDLMVDSSRPLNLEEVGVIGYFGGRLSLTVLLSGIE